jgi:hypothetical protein
MLAGAAHGNGRLATAQSRPHVAVMSDGRSHEMMAWLRRLPPRERLAMMYAIANVFPIIKIVRAWAAEINAALTELKPTPQEHEDIIAEGSRISRTLKRRLNADEPSR